MKTAFALVAMTLVSVSAFADSASISLNEGWRIQNSQTVNADGDVVSKSGYNDSSWYEARIPSTVLGNLVDDSVGTKDYKDPFYGTNLSNLMGTAPFSPLDGGGTFPDETPDSSPFANPWWYRREFTMAASSTGQQVQLVLDGITYGAEVWVNGNKIAERQETQGSYRAFHWEIAGFLNPPGVANTVAVEVWTPEPHDLTPSWVDWNFTPQDKNMGLWRGASINVHGVVSIDHPQVISSVSLPAGDQAALTVETEVTNTSDQPVSGLVVGTIEGITFSQPVNLDAGDSATVSFSPDKFPQLNIKNPRLWWPAQMGTPNLYHLNIAFRTTGNTVSDQKELDFGIRQVDSNLTDQDSRQFFINGKPLLIRGGGWASDLFLRFSVDRIEKEMNYVLDMGLNTIRLEGDIQPDDFYTMADRKGILVMPGLVCCNAWQMDEGAWKKDQQAIADASVRDLILALRAHPSVFVFLYGSDDAPSEDREQMYLDALRDLHFANPVVASAATNDTKWNGSTGFKMRGPYDYTPPSFWYTDKSAGGAFGFNTETSPGPSIPPMDSLKKFLPSADLDHIDDVWNFHAGQNGFANIGVHTGALEKIYGPIQNMSDMVEKSQLMDYVDHRAMFEAFNRNKNVGATGIIQWMLNNAWPSVIWHLYDYYLNPNAAYYGVKEANRPLHLIYGYDNQQVSLVNSTYLPHPGLHARAQVYDIDSNLISTQDATWDSQPNDTQPLLTIAAPASVRGNVYFVELSLTDAQGALIDGNVYWLSNQAPDHNLNPGDAEADYTALASMTKTSVKLSASWDASSKTETLTVSNPGKTIAFFLNFRLTDSAQNDILPVLWDDNDITLMPGESRTIQARFPNTAVTGTPELHGNGWNVQAW